MQQTTNTAEAPNMILDEEVRSILVTLSTATITMALLKKGLRNVWLRSAQPLGLEGRRLAGRAFTMRFIPAREDVSTPESLSSSRSTRGAIEDMPAGCIVVADAMGVGDVGILGDILCARMTKRSVAALVTDGAVRDRAGIKRTGLPVWCKGTAAPPSVAGLTFVGWQEPIACGGVAVFPGDIIVGDDDGVVVIPDRLLETVIRVALDTELLDTWILEQVETGRGLVGLYPPNETAAAEFEAWRRVRRKSKV